MRLLLISIILVTLSIFSIQLPAQTLIYKGYKGNDYIGDMVVTRKVEGEKVQYTSDAQLKVNFILSWEMRFYYEAEFHAGQLVRSLVKLSRDGKVRTQVSGKRQGDSFHSDVDGDPVETKGLIDYCILNTYFEAPTGREQIFSERWGNFIGFTDNKDGSFLLQPPNGSQNTLIYKEGICQEMKFNHTLANVRFVLKK